MKRSKGSTDKVRQEQVEEGKRKVAVEGEAVKETPSASAKPAYVPSDEPKTLEQLKEEGKLTYRVTPAAHRFLKGMGLDDFRKSSFIRELHGVVIKNQSDAKGRQLTLEETKAAVEFLREKRKKALTDSQEHDRQYREAMNLRADESSPNKDDEVCVANAAKTCAGNFQPTARFAVRTERVVKDGQEVTEFKRVAELGNYGVFRVDDKGDINPENGELMACGVCKECARELGGSYLTWTGAQAKIEAVKAELADEQDRSRRAEILRRSLVMPGGEPRFNTGRASTDISQTADFLARRNKRDFQRRR